jgi:hypothetical protein
MKALQSAAVFGLLPVPPVPDTHEYGRDRDTRPTMSEDDSSSQGAGLSPSLTERMATKGELARLREELEAISAD